MVWVLIKSGRSFIMKLYGATVYIKFDSKDERLKNMMDTKHNDYKKIPEELISLRTELQNRYKNIVPIDFRYFYALEKFEMMGILMRYEDAVDFVLEVKDKLTALTYKNMITVGFGTVCLPDGFQELKSIDVLNKVLGHGVYSAFQFFKEKNKRKKEYDYFFFVSL